MPSTVTRYTWAVLLLAGGCGDPGTSPPPPPPPGTPALGLHTVVTGLDRPVFLTAVPGDPSRLFVVEKSGRIQVILNGVLQPEPFLDLSARVSDGNEQGLLGLAFHPQYNANGLAVVYFTNVQGDTEVALFQASPGDPNHLNPASEQQILTVAQPFANHNGGMVAFDPTGGDLFIGLGDGGSAGDPNGNAQSLSTLLGKILRLRVSPAGQVSVPADNPFAGTSGARPEIWSLGLRNPWRFSFDRNGGNLYIGDVGQGAREEVDVVTLAASRGANFGWNLMEGSVCYPPGSNCSQAGITPPVLDYDHAEGCSVTGGYVYRGGDLIDLRGTYFYADYCGGWVRSFRFEGGVATEPIEWATLAPGGSITSFGEDAQGELYILTDAGRVAKIILQ